MVPPRPLRAKSYVLASPDDPRAATVVSVLVISRPADQERWRRAGAWGNDALNLGLGISTRRRGSRRSERK